MNARINRQQDMLGRATQNGAVLTKPVLRPPANGGPPQAAETAMEMPEETDDDLIRACRSGDAAAWERVLDKYERLVFSIPLNYGLSHDDASDIAQLTFTSLLQSLDSLHEGSRLGAWLATVARRNTWRVIERGRRESSEEYEGVAETLPSLGKDSMAVLERWEMIEWLNYGMTQLNARCRDLLQALYFEPDEASYADVAARLGMPVGGVGPTRARCLERLKQILEER